MAAAEAVGAALRLQSTAVWVGVSPAGELAARASAALDPLRVIRSSLARRISQYAADRFSGSGADRPVCAEVGLVDSGSGDRHRRNVLATARSGSGAVVDSIARGRFP